MAAHTEPVEPVESKEECNRREIAVEHSKLEKALRVKCVAAPKIIERILKLALEVRFDREVYQPSLRLFAENMKKASVYKKRAVGERISTLTLPAKIAIVQSILEVGIEKFSLDLCLSTNNRRGAITDGITKFQKPKCPMPMAFGLNKNGRLGIGSDKEKVDGLTPVEFFFDINHVLMGPNHTIFQSRTGELYGCGLKSNFMEGAKNSMDLVTTPTKIYIYKGDPSVTPNIILGETHTTIVEFNELTTLIIGTDSSRDNEIERSDGNNFRFVNKKLRIEENQDARERQIKEIEVDVHEKPRRKIKVCNDSVWFGRNEQKLNIVFIVDGYRVDSEKLWKNYTVCTNGKVMAIIDNNIYKGKFLIVPRKKNNEELNDQLSEDEEEEEVQMVGKDLHLVKRDDILLCILEEVALPYAFDKLAVNEDGESFIAWSNRDTTFDDFEYEKYRIYESLETIKPQQTEGRSVFDASYLDHLYEKTVVTEITGMSGLYMNNGQLKNPERMRGLLALLRFLRTDTTTGVPEALLNNIQKDGTLDVKAVEKEFEEAFREASKLSVIVTKSDFNSKSREEEVRRASRDYYLEVNNVAKKALRNLRTLPPKYRSNIVESAFGVFVARIIQSIGLVEEETISAKLFDQPPNRKFKRDHFQEALKKRSEMSPNQPDLDLKQIRVEASPLLPTQDSDQRTIYKHHAYYIYTTEFHIRCIDASLLDHVNEDNVLNLNILCLHDTTHDRFLDLLDSFFLFRDDCFHLKSFERMLNFESAMESLPEYEVYTIQTSDEKIVKIPKYLFEVYSEYDAGRQNFRRGPNGRNFRLGCTEEALKLLVNCLIDVRVFYKASMKLKMEVYALAKYLLIRHIWSELRMMIVWTAEENDADYIEDLIEQTDEKEDMLGLIATHRPEIIFFWKQFPAKDHLFVIQNIATRINNSPQLFKDIEDEIGSLNLPIIATRDEMVDEEMIPEPILTKYLCNKEDHDVVTFECTKSVLNWSVPNPRKRRHM